MAHTGRVTKLTPAIQTAIVNAITAGVPVVQAAQLVGIGKSTVLEWLQRGEGRVARGAQRRYTEFADAIARAKAFDEARRLARLEQAGRGGVVIHEKTTQYADGRVVTEKTYTPPDWRADAFYLERAYPSRWGRKVQADLTLEVRQIAEEIGKEIGVSADEILREAQSYLKDRR